MSYLRHEHKQRLHVFNRIFRRFKLKNESNDLHRLEEFQSISQSLIASTCVTSLWLNTTATSPNEDTQQYTHVCTLLHQHQLSLTAIVYFLLLILASCKIPAASALSVFIPFFNSDDVMHWFRFFWRMLISLRFQIMSHLKSRAEKISKIPRGYCSTVIVHMIGGDSSQMLPTQWPKK